MQSACIGSLMELADKDNRILYLTSDSGEGGLDRMYRMNFSERSFDFGIAEENMVAAAAGMAAAGKIPFVYSAAPFLVYRAYEFIRNDVCMQDLNVKLIGVGSGLSVSSLGPTHHTSEDIALLRVLPNLMILSPATPVEVSQCIKLAYAHKGPVYIRLAMNREKEYFSEDNVDVSIAHTLKYGNDISLITTGSILEEVLNTANMLKEVGVDAEVIEIPMIKPIDKENLDTRIGKRRLLVTIEEHSIYGGLGGIISEMITDKGVGQKLLRIGLNDEFTCGYGSLDAVRKENQLDAHNIYSQIVRKLNDE